MEKIVVIDALRTPIGKYHGKLANYSAVELGEKVTNELIRRQKEIAKKINYVIFGNVLQAGNGQNPARQISLKSGLDVSIPAVTINEVCGSGMKAIALARQMLQLHEAEVVLAGGVESMTNAPSISHFDKATQTYSNPEPVMFVDGLKDAMSGQMMGMTAENVAHHYHISREEQDSFAFCSQKKAAHAQENGWFAKEMVPIQINDGEYLTLDEGIRPQTTKEKLATLKTVFQKENGTVTAGNASTINDGASAMLLCTKSYALANQIPYLAEIEDLVEVGVDPEIMGISPIKAIEKLLQRNHKMINDIDLFEINEAFAASSLVVERQLGIPQEKVNIAGGGISLGHAIGATGARIVTTLIHQLRRTNQKTGVASLCVGGGIGLALLLQLPERTNADKQVRPFYKKTPLERRAELQEKGIITSKQQSILSNQELPESLSDHLIENQISDFPLPMGIARHLVINGKEYTVPLVTEEPSVIAACSNGAKMAKATGGFTATATKRLLRGQIVFTQVAETKKFVQTLEKNKERFYQVAEQAYPSIIKRGGGVRDIKVRTFFDSPTDISLDIFMDTQEAMGANMLNTVLEEIANEIRRVTSEKILMSILSNYATEAIVSVRCTIPFDQLTKGTDGKIIAQKIVEAARYAKYDVYRATTHNKGIMNGIEAFVLATGNDTRAIAAAIHTYAARNGSYQGLSDWTVSENGLTGAMELPLIMASVGGATKVLPKAHIVHEMLENPSAQELAFVASAVGLAQNLAALRALVSEGIQRGHMELQARSLAMSIGAKADEIDQVAERLSRDEMNQAKAQAYLQEIRQQSKKGKSS